MSLYDLAMRAHEGDAEALEALKNGAVRADGRRTIIACDFDNTLCESEWPTIIRPNEPLIWAVKTMREMGYEFILWSCRELDSLDEALEWCAGYGVYFDAVNDNAQSIKDLFDYNSRKINADEYWDDKAYHTPVK